MTTSITENAGSTFTGTITSGVTVIVTSGAAASGVTVLSGGILSVLSGGSATSVTVSGGGEEILAVAATASVTSVLSGGEQIVSGQTLLDSGLYVASGGIEDFSATFTNLNTSTTAATFDRGAVVEWTSVTSGTPTATSVTGLGETKLALKGDIIYLSGYPTTIATTGNPASTTITCFAAGTQILTGGREVAIETLQPGDTVAVLRDGETVHEPVTWVGSSKINLDHHAHPELAAPVRVKAGALAENTPARDLLLSPEHCLVISGRCIPVKYLVNGGSIAREFPTEPFEYYHVELENHGILIAEGAAAESYLDTGNRASFDNADMPRLLHPTFEVNASSDRWTTDACAPLASVPDEVAPVWEALAERSAALGLEVLPPEMAEDPDLHILADGQRIQPISDRNSRFVFMVPAGTKSVTLGSRFCIPADKMIASLRDTRRLGVRVNWMAIRSETAETVLSADHPGLNDGWNEIEGQGKSIWRWTDGSATIPWENVAGASVLTVCCTTVDQYPLYDDKARFVA
jgi:autotransporter passenger strand-loop-strand repeat protein